MLKWLLPTVAKVTRIITTKKGGWFCYTKARQHSLNAARVEHDTHAGTL